MLVTKIFNLVSVGWTKVFSDDFFRNVPTNVFAVVTRFFSFHFFLLGFENLRTRALIMVWGVEWEDERSFSIGGGS